MGFNETFASGHKFECDIVNSISTYCQRSWLNTRLPTLYTQSGYTEVDIITVYNNTIIVIESKNASELIGSYHSQSWTLIGKRSQDNISISNSIVQNNIHARALSDLLFKHGHVGIEILPVIIVPNDCIISPEISNAVFHLKTLVKVLDDSGVKKNNMLLHIVSSVLEEGAVR